MKRMSTTLRQEQIINTAMRIISEEGFPAFTTRKLAAEIGVSEPALYRHFQNKDHIIIGIIKKMDELWNRISKAITPIEDCREKLYLFMKMHFSYIEKTPDIVAILFADEYIRMNKEISAVLGKVQIKRYEYLVNFLKEARDKNIFKKFDPSIAAVVILGTVRSTILNWRNSPEPFSLSEYGEAVINTIIEMLLLNANDY